MPEKKPFSDIKRASKLRSLGEGEKALWDSVTKDVAKMKAKSPVLPLADTLPEVKIVRPKPPKSKEPYAELHKDVHGWITLEMPLPPVAVPPKSSKSSHQVDASLKKKVIQGDVVIDGKIDLHGLNLEQAHQKFISFLSSHISRGSRFLLVVTGKGVGGEGVIRRSFPHWCEESAHSRQILQIHQAAPKHGGSGAFYILLRRPRGA